MKVHIIMIRHVLYLYLIIKIKIKIVNKSIIINKKINKLFILPYIVLIMSCHSLKL